MKITISMKDKKLWNERKTVKHFLIAEKTMAENKGNSISIKIHEFFSRLRRFCCRFEGIEENSESVYQWNTNRWKFQRCQRACRECWKSRSFVNVNLMDNPIQFSHWFLSYCQLLPRCIWKWIWRNQKMIELFYRHDYWVSQFYVCRCRLSLSKSL